MKEKIKKSAKKIVLWTVAIAVFIVGYYFVYLYCGYQRLPENVTLEVNDKNETVLDVNESFTLMSYNIGFGAYSDDYSFFMDGGEHGKALSKEAVLENMWDVMDIVNKADPDILLLQEVDIDGTRSYHVDQTAMMTDELEEYDSITAVNYDSPYFIYPFHDPTGKNKSGIMTFSKYNISKSWRKRLPVEESIYKYLDLDRAYTMTRVSTSNKKHLVIYNVHLSAYTSDGTIADEQLKMLLEDMMTEYSKGRYVIAAGDFNKDLLGDSSKYFERREGEFTWAKPINKELIPTEISIYAPTNAPSCRNADSAYKGDGSDFVLTVDGMLASANVKVVSSETIDTGFMCSDHNPVKYEIMLVNEETEAK